MYMSVLQVNYEHTRAGWSYSDTGTGCGTPWLVSLPSLPLGTYYAQRCVRFRASIHACTQYRGSTYIVHIHVLVPLAHLELTWVRLGCIDLGTGHGIPRPVSLSSLPLGSYMYDVMQMHKGVYYLECTIRVVHVHNGGGVHIYLKPLLNLLELDGVASTWAQAVGFHNQCHCLHCL